MSLAGGGADGRAAVLKRLGDTGGKGKQRSRKGKEKSRKGKEKFRKAKQKTTPRTKPINPDKAFSGLDTLIMAR